MERSILILGAGIMQLPAIRAARRLGVRVIAADGNAAAVGRNEVDEFLAIDLKDREALAEAALSIRERSALAGVFTAGTDFSASVAYVCERVGLPGTSYEAALNATDKFRMRGVLRAAGVPVPRFAVATREELETSGLTRVRTAVELPVVVKPADSMGARGVVRSDSWEDAYEKAIVAAGFSRTARVVIEGYISGPEFSLDAIVYEDDIQITGFADRHICFAPYFIEMGHTIPTELEPAAQSAVIATFKEAIRALGIGPGAAKGDVKLSENGPVIGEVAARLSGGFMSGWTYPLSSGVPLSEIGVRVALGEVPPRATPRWQRTSAERAVISIPGRLRAITGIAAARALDSVEEVFVSRVPGDDVVFPRNNVEKIANVIAVADDRDSACGAAEAAVRLIDPDLEPGNTETLAFLFGTSLPDAWKHSAFEDLVKWLDASFPGFDGAWDELWSRVRDAGTDAIRFEMPPDVLERFGGRRDWAWRSLDEVVQGCSQGNLPPVGRSGTVSRLDDASVLLLRAIARGGLQGGRFIMETLLSG